MIKLNTGLALAAALGGGLLAGAAGAASQQGHGHGKAHAGIGGESIAVVMHRVSAAGVGDAVGTITLKDGPYGLVVMPDLKGVPTGPHATHVHTKPNCGTATKDGKTVVAGAAGGHFDPGGAGKYLGPYLDGALGDLPNLFAEADGSVTIPVVAPRLTLAHVRGRALMMHAGPDRYRAAPGGHAGGGHGHGGHKAHVPHMHGGPRILCGVVVAADASAEAPARTIDIVIQGGRAAAGKRTIRVTEGERVELRWTTDKPVELHLHGYDIGLRVEPGRPASMTFDATVAGRFPVGVHGGGGHGNIVYVEVHPR